MIDQRAFEAVLDEMKTRPHPHNWKTHARLIIELYEAALWRPIEEAPRDKSWVLALFKNSKSGPGMIRWDGDGWIDSGLQVFQPSFLKKHGAMFRTITPPPQKGDADEA